MDYIESFCNLILWIITILLALLPALPHFVPTLGVERAVQLHKLVKVADLTQLRIHRAVLREIDSPIVCLHPLFIHGNIGHGIFQSFINSHFIKALKAWDKIQC